MCSDWARKQGLLAKTRRNLLDGTRLMTYTDWTAEGSEFESWQGYDFSCHVVQTTGPDRSGAYLAAYLIVI
jgi:hypothetical protein